MAIFPGESSLAGPPSPILLHLFHSYGDKWHGQMSILSPNQQCQCFVLLLFLRAYSIIRIRIWIHIESCFRFSENMRDSMWIQIRILIIEYALRNKSNTKHWPPILPSSTIVLLTEDRRLNIGTYQSIFRKFINSFTRWRDITQPKYYH